MIRSKRKTPENEGKGQVVALALVSFDLVQVLLTLGIFRFGCDQLCPD